MQLDNVALDTKSAFAFSASLTPAATNANIAGPQTFTVVPPVPLKTTDAVYVSAPANATAVLVGSAYVVSATQIGIWFVNTSAGNLTHDAGTFRFLVVRE